MRAAAISISMFTCLLAAPAPAEDNTAALMRELKAQPGVTVTHGRDSGQSYTEWRKAGVYYRLETRDGKETLVGDDESGAGAVMCSWMIYDEVRNALASCPADSFPALRADLDRDIPAIERFIVANSALPITIAELHARAEAQRAAAEAQLIKFEAQRARAAPPSPRTQVAVCTADAAGGLVGNLDAMGPDGRRAAIGKLLATPRWPVLNP